MKLKTPLCAGFLVLWYYINMKILLLLSAFFLAFPVSLSAQESIADGDLITTQDSFDIYIVKLVGPQASGKKFKRLILNPDIFNSYSHLSWDAVKTVSQNSIDEYALSEFVLEINPDGTVADPRVYRVSSVSDSDVGEKRWLNITAEEFKSLGYDWDSLYKINRTEASEDFYATAAPLTFAELSAPAGEPAPQPDPGQAEETIVISFSRAECDLEVPTSHATVQSAIDGALNGDTICLLAGVYTENVTIDGKNVILSGASAASTTVRGGGVGGSTVVIKNVSSAMLLENITIENGGDYGIWVEDASPVIKNNIIKDNFAGMRILGNSRPDIRYNVFADNLQGGAIVHNGALSDYTIDHNTFVDNGASGGKATILFDSAFLSSPISVTNNIFLRGLYGIHEPGPFNSKINNNLFYGQTQSYVRKEYSNYNSASALNALTHATGNKEGDPLLDADYKPKAGSGAIDGADDRQSNIGAY